MPGPNLPSCFFLSRPVLQYLPGRPSGSPGCPERRQTPPAASSCSCSCPARCYSRSPDISPRRPLAAWQGRGILSTPDSCSTTYPLPCTKGVQYRCSALGIRYSWLRCLWGPQILLYRSAWRVSPPCSSCASGAAPLPVHTFCDVHGSPCFYGQISLPEDSYQAVGVVCSCNCLQPCEGHFSLVHTYGTLDLP